ncbi:MAG: PP2C family protein-serine/threonine phosphatase [Coleofasciculaceae cyanobacterium SM2_1_6]|nr:PP2C family protein-serine/threonine phosphatase [Coleofasciculaceae cyanobacterium SM2_1_6]
MPVQPNPQSNSNNQGEGELYESTPVYVLKELLHRFQREQTKIQDLLSSLGFALRSFNNLNQFLEIIPMMAARVTDADSGALFLFKPNGKIRLEQLYCLEGHSCEGMRGTLEVIAQRLNSNIDSEFNNSSNSSSNNSSNSSEHNLGSELKDLSSLINGENLKPSDSLDQELANTLDGDLKAFGTPIWVKSVDVGRLYVFSRDPLYIWTGTRQKLLRLVADQTAVAIATNELTVELRKKERIDRELEIGADIQRHLLPSRCPEILGVELAAQCETAGRVGGDYYDFIPAHYDRLGKTEESGSHDKWSIVIGDVMGKGVPAGLIMTMTRGMLRAEVLNGHSPGNILQHLNRVMYTDLENSRRFVTLFYSEYDPQTRMLAYSNAAHHPPLLWQAATNSLSKLDGSAGMLIGLDIDSVYDDFQVQLAGGDTIMYYTDGFTDAANSDGDRFDEDQLSQTFQHLCQQSYAPQEILEHLFNQVQQFSNGGNGKVDDMTLLVMRIK